MAHIDAFDGQPRPQPRPRFAVGDAARRRPGPVGFADVLLRVIPVEEHTVVLRTILRTTKQIPSMLLATLRWFLPEAARPAMVDKSVNVIRTALDAAVPGSDKQQQLVVAYAASRGVRRPRTSCRASSTDPSSCLACRSTRTCAGPCSPRSPLPAAPP